jgi:hypothetical protein
MNKHKWLKVFLMTMLLTGCGSLPRADNTQATETIPPTAQVTPSSTIKPTLQTLPTATLPATNTPDPSHGQVITQCLEIQPAILPEAYSNSVLILDNRALDETGRIKFGTFFMDMTTAEKKQIAKPKETLLYFAVSPDQKIVAYEEVLLDANMNLLVNNLVITTSDNQVVKQIPWEHAWDNLVAWLDNQQLLISLNNEKDYLDNPIAAESTFMIFDPFTGDQKVLRPDFPDIYNQPPVLNWDGWGETAYNWSLDRVVYLKGLDQLYYAFWDIEKQKEIMKVPVADDLDAVPRWAPDNQHFAFSPSLYLPDKPWPKYELYDVARNGLMTQMTYLSDFYYRACIADLSWSPDGNSIAFWFSYWPEGSNIDLYSPPARQFLAILDIKNNSVTNYCIPGEVAEIGVRFYPPPMWSPNSRQVVVQSQTAEDPSMGDAFDVILVDIPTKQAFRLGQDLEPVGWMVAP